MTIYSLPYQGGKASKKDGIELVFVPRLRITAQLKPNGTFVFNNHADIPRHDDQSSSQSW
jgi:hypothetical protein